MSNYVCLIIYLRCLLKSRCKRTNNITYTPGSSFWSTVLASVKSTYKMPIKKLIGGEVLLAGKLGSHWGGMYIKKN